MILWPHHKRLRQVKILKTKVGHSGQFPKNYVVSNQYVLLGKLKSYETMQGLVFLPLVAKFLMKWRFLLEPIGEFPSVVLTPKIGRSFEALKVIA